MANFQRLYDGMCSLYIIIFTIFCVFDLDQDILNIVSPKWAIFSVYSYFEVIMDVASPAPEAAHLCNTCHDSCDSDNAVCCAACTSSFIHDNCLIKIGRDKSAKKVQGAAPIWLRDVLHHARIRYFFPSCILGLDFARAKLSTLQDPQKIAELEAKVNAIDNKVDLLLSTLVESAQPTIDAAVTSDQTNSSMKPLYSKIAAQAPTRDLLKDVMTEVIQSREHKAVQDTSVVLLGVPLSKDDAKMVSDIMAAINCSSKIVKIQRLGKYAKSNISPAAESTAQPANRVLPLLVSFQTELDRFNVNAMQKCFLLPLTVKFLFVNGYLRMSYTQNGCYVINATN